MDTIKDGFGSNVDIYATYWSDDIEALITDPLGANRRGIINIAEINHLIEFEQEAILQGFKYFDVTDSWKPLPIFMLGRIEYAARNSFFMIKDPGSYDFIVRSRYDHRYLKNILPYLDEETLLLSDDLGGSAPEDQINGIRAIYDGFAAGKPPMMYVYYHFVEWLKLVKISGVVKSEQSLGYFLNEVKDVMPVHHMQDIIACQLNEKVWFNRSHPPQEESLQKRKTHVKKNLSLYKTDLKKYHPHLYDKLEVARRIVCE